MKTTQRTPETIAAQLAHYRQREREYTARPNEYTRSQVEPLKNDLQANAIEIIETLLHELEAKRAMVRNQHDIQDAMAQRIAELEKAQFEIAQLEIALGLTDVLLDTLRQHKLPEAAFWALETQLANNRALLENKPAHDATYQE